MIENLRSKRRLASKVGVVIVQRVVGDGCGDLALSIHIAQSENDILGLVWVKVKPYRVCPKEIPISKGDAVRFYLHMMLTISWLTSPCARST